MYYIKLAAAIIFSVIGIVGTLPYIFDTIKNKTKPHMFTWFIWMITLAIAMFSVIDGGGGLAQWGYILGLILVVVVFLLSLFKGTKDISGKDYFVLLGAIIALFFYWGLKDPVRAIILASGIDAIGYIPTFRKSYKDPYSETTLSWGLFAVGNICGIIALESYNILTLTYLFTLLVCNGGLYLFLLLRRKQLSS